MGGFLEYIISALLQLLVLAIIVSAILSWLVAFDVINLRHPVARQVVIFLDAVTRPVLRPIQAILPTFGGLDLSPLVAIIILQGAQTYLLPWIFSFILPVTGG